VLFSSEGARDRFRFYVRAPRGRNGLSVLSRVRERDRSSVFPPSEISDGRAASSVEHRCFCCVIR